MIICPQWVRIQRTVQPQALGFDLKTSISSQKSLLECAKCQIDDGVWVKPCFCPDPGSGEDGWRGGARPQRPAGTGWVRNPDRHANVIKVTQLSLFIVLECEHAGLSVSRYHSGTLLTSDSNHILVISTQIIWTQTQRALGLSVWTPEHLSSLLSPWWKIRD